MTSAGVPGCFDALKAEFEETEPGFFHARDTQPGEYPTQHHAVQAAIYDNSFWYQHRQACILDLLERHPVTSLLDVGGSHGLLTEAISERCPAALLEPDTEGARAAWQRGLRPVFNGNLSNMAPAAGSVAAVGLFDVLEHIPDDRAFLRTLHGLLERDGLLIITVPAFDWLWSDFDQKVGHQRRFTRRALKKRLRECGFEPLRSTYLFSVLPIPMWLIRPWRQGGSSDQHHFARASMTGRLLSAILAVERHLLRLGLTMPLGSSCLCAARKVGA